MSRLSETKIMAAESRVILFQSERKVRNKILAIRERIESSARRAERKLLRELQDLVRSQENAIKTFEETVTTRMYDNFTEMPAQHIEDQMSLQIAEVVFQANESFDQVFGQAMSFGQVRLELPDSGNDGYYDQCGPVIPEHRSGSYATLEITGLTASTSGGYIVGRIAKFKDKHGNSYESLHLPENEKVMRDEYEARAEHIVDGTFVPTLSEHRRRGNALRKTATVLMNGHTLLENKSEEHNNRDDVHSSESRHTSQETMSSMLALQDNTNDNSGCNTAAHDSTTGCSGSKESLQCNTHGISSVKVALRGVGHNNTETQQVDISDTTDNVADYTGHKDNISVITSLEYTDNPDSQIDPNENAPQSLKAFRGARKPIKSRRAKLQDVIKPQQESN